MALFKMNKYGPGSPRERARVQCVWISIQLRRRKAVGASPKTPIERPNARVVACKPLARVETVEGPSPLPHAARPFEDLRGALSRLATRPSAHPIRTRLGGKRNPFPARGRRGRARPCRRRRRGAGLSTGRRARKSGGRSWRRGRISSAEHSRQCREPSGARIVRQSRGPQRHAGDKPAHDVPKAKRNRPPSWRARSRVVSEPSCVPSNNSRPICPPIPAPGILDGRSPSRT
jgi:hypothetical protein